LQQYGAEMDNRVLELAELHIDLNSDGFSSIDLLNGFFVSCSNIRKLSLNLHKFVHTDVPDTLRKFLPLFARIKELEVCFYGVIPLEQLFLVINECCLNLQILIIPSQFVTEAENFFRERGVVIECSDMVRATLLKKTGGIRKTFFD
jgi:hypothetical protein